MKILIAGGGTGGHIYPAIAIANAAAAKYKNCEILFAGTKKGMEKDLVPKAGYNIEFIEAEGLKRSFSADNIRVILKTFRGFVQAKRIIRHFRPDVVIGTGGYVSGPVVFAAHTMKIPTMIHEQNALAGITSKILSKNVDRICLAFDDINLLNQPKKSVVTGNPVRSAFKGIDVKKCREELCIDDGRPFVLCVSGSLGAEKINNCMADYIKSRENKNDCHILMVTGERYYKEVSDKLSAINNPRVHIKKYVYDIEKYLGAADLIISRSGALFMSEIAYLGKPSILIPSPNVSENHQEFNADMFVKKGCSVKISEKDLTSAKLEEVIDSLLKNKKRLSKMSMCAYNTGIRNADEAILKVVDDICHP